MNKKNSMSNEEIKKEVEKDLEVYSKLDALKDSEGGQILINSLYKDLSASLNVLISKYKTATHIELIALAAKFEANFNLLKTLLRARKNKKLAKTELERLIEEVEK